MEDSGERERPNEQAWLAPDAYLDMSLDERRRLIAQLHAKRSREMGLAILGLARLVCRLLGKILHGVRQK